MTIPIFALDSITGPNTEQLHACKQYNWLISYWVLRNKKELKKHLDNLNKPGDTIFMLDSGAYSAWTRGEEVNLWDYINFIKKYHFYFTHIVCLDVIDDPISSEINHLIMQTELENLDIQLIPVYHAGEDFSVLEYMINRSYGYIGISPNNNWVENDKRSWLSDIHDRFDFSKFKTHGFGYTSIQGIGQYDLTTADSTSWRLSAGYGSIITDNGTVLISNRGRKKNKEIKESLLIPDDKKENQNLKDIENSDFVLSICDKLDAKPDQLQDDYYLRLRFNIEATIRLINSESDGYNVISKENSLVDVRSPLNLDGLDDAYKIALLLGKRYTGYG